MPVGTCIIPVLEFLGSDSQQERNYLSGLATQSLMRAVEGGPQALLSDCGVRKRCGWWRRMPGTEREEQMLCLLLCDPGIKYFVTSGSVSGQERPIFV